MRSYHVKMGAGLDGLTLREHDDPDPGPEDVVVRVKAVSLNFREHMILVQGLYPLPVRDDVVAAADGAGEVVAVGKRVTRAKIGDRIAASVFPDWIDGGFSLENSAQLGGTLDGMLTELAILNERAVVQVPEHLSFEEAATLPCAAVTAWNALTGARPLRAGETVLTLGSGGVSLFALQFAKVFGARVIATTSSDEKAARLRTLGADEVINYRARPDWHLDVRRLTGGQGVDHVVEVGGTGTLAKSFQAAAIGGEVVWIGMLSSGEPTIDGNVIYNSGASLRVIAVGSRAQFVAMNRCISVNRMRPIIDRVFEFNEAGRAFAYYEAGDHFGKVVIRVAQ